MAEFKVKVELTFPFANLMISPFPGLYIEFTPSLVFEFGVTASIDGTLSGTIGVKVSTKSGCENLTTSPQFSANRKIEASVFLRLSLELRVLSSELFVGNIS